MGGARVAITGIGVVSPFGAGRERFWTHVSRGCSGTRAIAEFDASVFPCSVAAPVPASVTMDDAVEVEARPPGPAAVLPRVAHRRPRRA